ncbi:unnamed protein product [Darwinula stevensoni]|uniref:Uncharacterized protein n=1 Tax=Darwinula stevensoni TaxID=69355 RepID=A0A7R8X354_9CRUS|nr:unnamed protein product [Darwinula stevensoni]CAG0884629.1 unnamed protein product [Darwinula stevensoni]
MLKSVKPEDKSMAMALVVVVTSLFAFIPGPIIYGAIIDSTCLIWKEPTCGTGKGNCAFYDSDKFRIALHAWTAGFVAVALIFDVLVWIQSRDLVLYPEKKDDQKTKSRNGTTTT